MQERKVKINTMGIEGGFWGDRFAAFFSGGYKAIFKQIRNVQPARKAIWKNATSID